MPVVSLSAITGKDVPSLIESLERQRKELEFILSSLDNDNVLELNGGLINQGVVQAQYVEVGSGTTFQSGYDPSDINYSGDIAALESEIDTLQSVVASMETTVATSQTEIDALEVQMGDAQTEIDALEVQMGDVPSQIAESRIIDSVTSDPVGAVVGQMWLRSDL